MLPTPATGRHPGSGREDGMSHIEQRDAEIKAILTSYGATDAEIQRGSLTRRQRQPVDWTLVAQLTAVPCDKAEVAGVLGMSYGTLIRAIRLWPEHAHLFKAVAP